MAKPLPDGFSVEVVKLQLASYLAHNTYSSVAESETDDPWPFIKKPWGDDSLEIRIPHDDPALIAALNHLILPERFVAVWHRDTEELEIIYTAYPLTGSQKDVVTRKFTFLLGEKKVECEFAPASPRLMLIAENFFSVAMSNTNQRNLNSFRHYILSQRGAEDVPKLPAEAAPVCFWVRGLKWNETEIADTAMHLNFYMTYFDIHSPTINVLPPPKQELSEEKRRERYIAGRFPTEIRGKELNINLLHYWAQSRSGADTIRKFLYAYQIIEYASFYFVEEGVKRSLRRALARPNISDEIDNIIIEVMDSISEKKNWDGQKMTKLFKTIMGDGKLIWREIEKNRGYFSVEHKFDGGFVLPALISKTETKETFSTNWENDFCKDMRDIRNALSHGREQSLAGVIAPTDGNMTLLGPWAELAVLIAGETMVYSHAAI